MELSKKMGNGLKIASVILIAFLILAIGVALGSRWSRHSNYSYNMIGYNDSYGGCGRGGDFERGDHGCNKQFRATRSQGGQNCLFNNNQAPDANQIDQAPNGQINPSVAPVGAPDLNIAPTPATPAVQ